jgi:multicomponent Na+:H+ antiporter subunit G
MTALGLVLVVLGAVLLLVAGWGVLRLPDALSRQHASTKAGTLALALVALGAMALVGQTAWTWRLALVLLALLVTLPVSSQLLARAAAREAGFDADRDPPADRPP